VKVGFFNNDCPITFGALRKNAMDLTYSRHAIVRTQQRGIPHEIASLLVDYGKETFDGHGGVVRYFTPKSIRAMSNDGGQDTMKKMSEYLRCYLVQSSDDGAVITVGKRHAKKHIWRH
jgi:hypothetical protein